MFRLKPFLMTAGLIGSLFGFACGPVSAQVAPVEPAPAALQGPEQRVALVIGNSNYKNAPQLVNPDNDAESMAKFLNSAGFEVVAATDLTQNAPRGAGLFRQGVLAWPQHRGDGLLRRSRRAARR